MLSSETRTSVAGSRNKLYPVGGWFLRSNSPEMKKCPLSLMIGPPPEKASKLLSTPDAATGPVGSERSPMSDSARWTAPARKRQSLVPERVTAFITPPVKPERRTSNGAIRISYWATASIGISLAPACPPGTPPAVKPEHVLADQPVDQDGVVAVVLSPPPRSHRPRLSLRVATEPPAA